MMIKCLELSIVSGKDTCSIKVSQAHSDSVNWGLITNECCSVSFHAHGKPELFCLFKHFEAIALGKSQVLLISLNHYVVL